MYAAELNVLEDDIENLPIEESDENIEEPTAINGDDYVETVFQNS